MSIKGQDPEYLRSTQYKNSSNLSKRANLHEKYGTSGTTVFQWFSDLVDWSPGGSVLDVGCGLAWLWDAIAPTLPAGLDLTLSDLSPGMIEEAVPRAEATGRYASVRGQVCDARSLPFGDDSFDVVVSTYALYHVPDPLGAVAQMARVLKPGGTMAIITNGPGHLAEIESIAVAVLGSRAEYSSMFNACTPAMMSAALTERFAEVWWRRYDDELHCTDPEDVIAFLLSSPTMNGLTIEEAAQIRQRVFDSFADQGGVFKVKKHTGAIIGR